MADFQETAREKIKQLSAKRAEVRRDAAYYLGEAGHDEAITRLAWLYKNDPDKSVREAAKYALGQFRAVELALEHGDEGRVVGLLEGIVNDGKMGRRLKTRPAKLGVFVLILLAVWIVLIAAILLIPGKKPLPGPLASLKLPGAAVQPTTVGPTTLTLDQIQPAYTAIESNTNTLVTQFQTVLTGGSLDCTAFLNSTSPITLNPADATAHPELASAIKTINDAQTSVSKAETRYQAACFKNQPLKTEELGGLLAPLVAAQRDLPGAQQAIATAQAQALVTPSATPEPSITPALAQSTSAVAPTAAANATPTVAGADLKTTLVTLYDIVSDMNAPRGANGLLKQYWQDAQRAGRTDGCNQAQPDIPDDYTLSAADAQAAPQLTQAVALINEGLAGVRRNWSDFYNACAGNRLARAAAQGLQIADASGTAFQTASTVLDGIRPQ